jgi:hypothetical protein
METFAIFHGGTPLLAAHVIPDLAEKLLQEWNLILSDEVHRSLKRWRPICIHQVLGSRLSEHCCRGVGNA